MLIALATTWAQAAVMTTATAADPERLHERRRAALARAVERSFSA